jgi:hypothetical protein
MVIGESNNNILGGNMALVRKTDEIKKEINQCIDNLIVNKCQKLFRSLDITEAIHHFFETAYYNGVLFPSHCAEVLKTASDPSFTNIFEINRPHFSCIFIGQDAEGTPDHICNIEMPAPDGFALPSARHALLSTYVPSKLGTFMASNDELTYFTVVFVMPVMHGGEIHANDHKFPCLGTPYSGTTRDDVLNTSRILQADDFPAPVEAAWVDLMNRRNQVWDVLKKFEATRDYIFANLWAMPSVNKMIEFFPNLKGLLSDKTVGRYMKGTSRKKSEYQVVAPSADVIGATVEANLQSFDDE